MKIHGHSVEDNTTYGYAKYYLEHESRETVDSEIFSKAKSRGTKHFYDGQGNYFKMAYDHGVYTIEDSIAPSSF